MKGVVATLPRSSGSVHVRSAGFRTLISSATKQRLPERVRMEGGFHRLVVLHRGRHRKPVGLLHSEQLLAMTKPVFG